MKFENVLQIYWTKGFFYGGQLFYFDQTPNDLMERTPGLGKKFFTRFTQRFESTVYRRKKTINVQDYQALTHRKILIPLNVIYSQVSSVNSTVTELKRLNIIRLYLIKSYRGRCHAIGKPVRGQRTWSNAWMSYNTNKVLRTFISEARRKANQNKKEVKKNYKVVQKKYITKKKKKDHEKIKKKSVWY